MRASRCLRWESGLASKDDADALILSIEKGYRADGTSAVDDGCAALADAATEVLNNLDHFRRKAREQALKMFSLDNMVEEYLKNIASLIQQLLG